MTTTSEAPVTSAPPTTAQWLPQPQAALQQQPQHQCTMWQMTWLGSSHQVSTGTAATWHRLLRHLKGIVKLC